MASRGITGEGREGRGIGAYVVVVVVVVTTLFNVSNVYNNKQH